MVESRREANKRKSRQKILKASRRLFKEKGYENTMIEDVANRAEISKATLYNYFPNKESLLVGTMDDVAYSFKKFIDGMDKNMPIDDRIRKAMTFLILDSIPFISVSRRILYLNATEASTMYGKANEVRDMLIDMSEKAKEEGELKKEVSSKEFADLMMGVYLTSQFQWNDIEIISQQECRDRVDRIFDLIIAGCCHK